MRGIILFSLLFLSLSSCNKPATSGDQADSHTKANLTPNFLWLRGNWVRTNNSEGRETYEFWEATSESIYQGIGYTMQGIDTVFQENMQLSKTNTGWAFIVNMPQESTATVFEVTEITPERFVAENPENEFPKRIAYYRYEGKLHAVISGNGQEVKFDFVRRVN